jgi:4-amino-4-deoxy-L-arabinose transferase
MMNTLTTVQPMNVKRRYTFLLLFFFLAAYILPLGVRDLFVPDETRYSEIPREMIARGDWVVPHLNGLRYFEKPPLGYWVNAGSILFFGENNFAVRLPSAMAVGLSALLIYVLVSLVWHNKSKENGSPATLAPLIFLSCFMVFGLGSAVLLDSLFSFFLTATITTFCLASEALPGSAREKGFLLLSGVSCGLGFLTKGFLAFAVPVLALAPYLIWQRRYFDLVRMSWLPFLAAVVVALPWGILIHLREPDFWRSFFWNEHIRRFMADSAQHKKAFWYFFEAAPGLFLPWTLMVPAAVPGIRDHINEQSPEGRLIKLSICWLVLPFLFFSFSSGKLLTYILPCFPPFAVLMVFGLLHVLRREGRSRLFQWGTVGSVGFSGLILFAFLYVQVFGYHGVRPYSQQWKVMMAVSSLVFFIVFCFWSLRSQKGRDKVLLFGLAPLLIFFMGPFIVPDQTLEAKGPGPLLERHKQAVGDDVVIISDEETIGAVCWYLQRSNVYVLGSPGELDYGLGYKDAEGRLLDMRSAVDLINRNPGKTVLIARVKKTLPWRNQIPKPVFQDETGPSGYMFWKY